jgi:hypothetical protein
LLNGTGRGCSIEVENNVWSPDVQVPFALLKPSATFKIGKTADWVLVTDD